MICSVPTQHSSPAVTKEATVLPCTVPDLEQTSTNTHCEDTFHLMPRVTLGWEPAARELYTIQSLV